MHTKLFYFLFYLNLQYVFMKLTSVQKPVCCRNLLFWPFDFTQKSTIYECMYIHIYLKEYIHMYICICAAYKDLHTCYIFIYNICLYLYTYYTTNICICVCVCPTYKYAHMYVCMHVCVHFSLCSFSINTYYIQMYEWMYVHIVCI